MKTRRVVIDFPADLELAGLSQEAGRTVWGAWLRVPATGFLQGAWAETPQQAIEEALRAIRKGQEARGESETSEATPLDELDL